MWPGNWDLACSIPVAAKGRDLEITSCKGQVKDLSVVSNELRSCSLCCDIPNRACCVDGRRSYQIWIRFVPVKAC